MADHGTDPGIAVPEADLREHRRCADPEATGTLNDSPTLAGASADHAAPGRSPTDRRLVDVAVRVHAAFAQHATLADVLSVIDGCRRDLDTASEEALPELVERLARHRIGQRIQNADGHREPADT